MKFEDFDIIIIKFYLIIWIWCHSSIFYNNRISKDIPYIFILRHSEATQTIIVWIFLKNMKRLDFWLYYIIFLVNYFKRHKICWTYQRNLFLHILHIIFFGLLFFFFFWFFHLKTLFFLLFKTILMRYLKYCIDHQLIIFSLIMSRISKSRIYFIKSTRINSQ